MLMATFILSLVGIAQKGKAILGLILLNWMLIVDGLAIIIIGSFIWFHTLMERNNYFHTYNAQTNATIAAVQDKVRSVFLQQCSLIGAYGILNPALQFSCCGYFFPNETTIVHTGFCSNATILNTTATCVGPITHFADVTLNEIFRCVYASHSMTV